MCCVHVHLSVSACLSVCLSVPLSIHPDQHVPCPCPCPCPCHAMIATETDIIPIPSYTDRELIITFFFISPLHPYIHTSIPYHLLHLSSSTPPRILSLSSYDLLLINASNIPFAVSKAVCCCCCCLCSSSSFPSRHDCCCCPS